MKTLTLILHCLALATVAHAQLNQMTLVGQYVGEAEGDYFGSGTAMGDFDADGQDEFIIGASAWNESRGKNYFYDWNGDWPAAPSWTFQGTTPFYVYDFNDQNVGDINADGIDDFGLTEGRAGQYGRLDLLWGGALFDSIPDWNIEQEPVFGFGESLDSCGDVNGDGGNDFIMGVRPNGPTDYEWRIYWGGSALDTVADVHLDEDYWDGEGLGDVNGDGYDDIMLLGYQMPPLLFFGGNPMDTIPDLVFNDYSSSPGSAIGDVNDDGFNDFSMAMHLPDSTMPLLCQPVYFGGPDVDSIPDAYLLDEQGSLTAALDYVTSGDVNGDGISDLITGDGSLIWGNVAYIYLGGAWFNPIPDALIIGVATYYNWGEEMAVGDVNGDGRDEILVASSNYWFDQGLAQLYTGPETWIDYGAAVEPGDLSRTPGWYKLDQNYPNPFNSSTSVHFEIGKPSTVSLNIFDVKGNNIQRLITAKPMLPGGYNVSWNGKNEENQQVSSGIYLLELRVDQYRQLRKIALLR